MKVSLVLVLSLPLLACSSTHTGDGGPDGEADAALPVRDSGLDPDAAAGDASVHDAGDDAGARDAGVDLSALFRAFCIRRNELLCAGNAACCDDRTRQFGEDECDSAGIESGCERASEDPALRDGSLRWDAVEAERVLAELESRQSECVAIDLDSMRVDQVLQGSSAEGEPCTPEAVNGLGSLGLLRCADGLRCALSGTSESFTGVCAEPGELGEGCVYPAADCVSGAWCEFGADGMSSDAPYLGLCVEQEDEPCAGDYACPSRFCTGAPRRCVEPEPAQTWCRRLL